jgi:hypothetical protein
MLKALVMRKLAIVFLLLGVVAGVAGAQAFHNFQRARFTNTGLFSVGPDEGVNFHVTLDDRRSGPPTKVLLRIFNVEGVIVARDEAILQPGHSRTLQAQGPGLFRAQAEILEPPFNLSVRRMVVSTVELFDVRSFQIRRFVCKPDDGVGGSRIPD